MYYFLVNDTKKKIIEYDCLVKRLNIRQNVVVQAAFINYMFDHMFDSFRLVTEDDYDSEEYERLDLKTDYKFDEETRVFIDMLEKDNV